MRAWASTGHRSYWIDNMAGLNSWRVLRTQNSRTQWQFVSEFLMMISRRGRSKLDVDGWLASTLFLIHHDRSPENDARVRQARCIDAWRGEHAAERSELVLVLTQSSLPAPGSIDSIDSISKTRVTPHPVLVPRAASCGSASSTRRKPATSTSAIS